MRTGIDCWIAEDPENLLESAELHTEDVKDYCILYDGKCSQLIALNNSSVDYETFRKNNQCKWFERYVLPGYPELLDEIQRSYKQCKYCGKLFIPNSNREMYCCEEHRKAERRKQLKEAQRSYRKKN